MFGRYSESAQQVWDFVRCQRPNGTHYGTAGKCRKGTEVNYEDWKTLAQGNYGKISVNPDGTRVVKTLLVHNGEKGTFGPHELELATKMGELGHSPKIHSSSDNHIEMDIAPGKPLWAGYARGKDEPVMNAAQATQAGNALKSLHKLGFYHGDNHSLQWLADGNNVKLVDYGLSGKAVTNPIKVMQDLAKISNLVRWDQKELANDPYFALVNAHLPRYRAITGQSKKAKAERLAIADDYLKGLEAL